MTLTILSLIGLLFSVGCGSGCGDFMLLSGCPDASEEVALGSSVEFVIHGEFLEECTSEISEGEAEIIGGDCDSVQVVPSEPGLITVSIVASTATGCGRKFTCVLSVKEPESDP